MEMMQTAWTADNIKSPNYLTRNRPRAVDRRTRRYRLWAQRRARLVAALGRPPSAPEDELLDVLADRLIAQDIRRAEQAEGIIHNEQEARSAASEIRRLLAALGLVGREQDDPVGGLSDLMGAGS